MLAAATRGLLVSAASEIKILLLLMSLISSYLLQSTLLLLLLSSSSSSLTHFLIVSTIIKFKEILFTLPPAFLVLIRTIILVQIVHYLILYLQNINNLCVSVSNYPMVAPNNYHLPLKLDFKLTLDCQSTFVSQRSNYCQGDYLLLHNTLSNCDWSCALNENFVALQFIISLLVCRRLLTKPFRL
jgi:hypothetical protein